MRRTRPGLRVLLVSGYAEEIVESGRDDSVPFLAKPFSAESLLTAVDAAMLTEPDAEASATAQLDAGAKIADPGPFPEGVAG